MLLGNEDDVGVAGRTLILLLCGDLVSLRPEIDTAGDAMDAEDVDDALECEWWCRGIERIDDTDEDVDFRPRSPPLDRRYEERGVSGAGLADKPRTLPEPCVETRGRGGTCVGVCECEWRFAALRRLRESGDLILLSGILGLFWDVLLALEFGLRARLLVSLIQLRRLRRWFRKGCLWLRCLGTKPLGWRRSGLDTTWSMLLRERRLSRSFAGGGGREVEWELRDRSIEGRGFSLDGRTMLVPDSGRRGRSGAAVVVS